MNQAKARLKRLGLRRPADMLVRLRRSVQRKYPRRYPRYGAAELADALAKVNVPKHGTVFVHSSWEEFYNFDGRPMDLIKILQDYIGPTGTIAMPAFALRLDPTSLFDVRRTPTGAGFIAETFRRMKGVERSIHLYQSVAAIGPNATYLVRDHLKSLTSWDKHSPFPRLADLDATILCLGLPRSFGLGTVLHCPESLLREEIPYFRQVFGPPLEYRYRDWTGKEGVHTVLPRNGQWRPNRVRRHIDPAQIRLASVSNLRVQAIDARYLTNRMVELARRGIVNYYWPWPSKRLFIAR
jgi:aminoglycoside 3-N-acetyltransferase